MTNTTKTKRTSTPLSTAFLRVKKTSKAVDATVKALLAVSPEVSTMLLTEIKDENLRTFLTAKVADAQPVAVSA